MGLLKEAIRRAGYLVRRTRFDSELDEEIRFHIETHAAELEQSGIARAEALAQAKREFGSAMRIREDTRWAWQFRWLDDLLADLRYAARALRHNPAFALTAIACLALGIGANTTIFSLSTEMLFSEPSSRDSQSLVKIWIGGSSASPIRDYRFIRDAGIFDGLAGENEETEVNWRQGDATDRLFTVRVTDNFFSVVGIPVAMGRPIEPGESDAVVLTHGFWQRRMGGDPAITVTPNGTFVFSEDVINFQTGFPPQTPTIARDAGIAVVRDGARLGDVGQTSPVRRVPLPSMTYQMSVTSL